MWPRFWKPFFIVIPSAAIVLAALYMTYRFIDPIPPRHFMIAAGNSFFGQKIASELRPGVLDCLGLEAAVEAEAEAFEERTNVRCECSVPGSRIQMPDAQATAVFRILQEILTNVARHAQATLVVISLLQEDSNLLLEVEDNGIGMNMDCVDDPNSLGLLGMQERAEPLGGKVTFRRNRRGGTTVAVQIPLPNMPDEPEEPFVFQPAFVEKEDTQSAA